MQVKVSTKLMLALGLMSVILLASICTISYFLSKFAFEKQKFQQLIAVRSMKQRQVETYFTFMKNQCATLAQDPLVISALKEFKSAKELVQNELKLETKQYEEYKKSIQIYYTQEFLTRLNVNLENPQIMENYIPIEEKNILLQSIYIAQNPNPVGQKDMLVSANNNTTYNKVHEKYHPIFRNYLKKFGYYDMFLIDPEFEVQYTVFKEIDFCNNLNMRALKDSNFNYLLKLTNNSQKKNDGQLVDFAPYDPSYAAPAGFVAAPIYDGETKIGMIAMQLPLDSITSIMTDDNHWQQMGFGLTGESFLIGKDYRMRSVARLLVEDPEKYYQVLKASGVPEKTIERIKVYKTSVFLQEIITPGTEAIAQGETVSFVSKDYRGVQVLTANAPLTIDELQWGIVSKIDYAEAMEPVLDFTKKLIILGLILWVLGMLIFFLILWHFPGVYKEYVKAVTVPERSPKLSEKDLGAKK